MHAAGPVKDYTRWILCALARICLLAPAASAQSLPWRQLPALPDHLGVAAPFAGVSGQGLLVAGGANFPDKMPWLGGRKSWTDRVWFLDAPDGNWKPIGTLPRPLAYGVSVTFGDDVICVGGSDADRHYAEVFRLRWDGSKLVTDPMPPLPQPLSGMCGAIVGSTLYIAGGCPEPGEKSASNRAFSLELSAAAASWHELPPVPGAGRLLPVAAASDRAFFVFGGAALETDPAGKSARRYLREAWRYRSSEGWTRLADLPHACVAAPSPAPVIDGRILLIGGDDGSRVGFQPIDQHPGFPTRILAYDPRKNEWSAAGETPAPRATVPTVQWNSSFVIPSGEVRPGVRSPEVWSLNPTR